MSIFDRLTGTPLEKAVAKRDGIRRRLADAEGKRVAIAEEIETNRVALREAVGGEDETSPDKIASKLAKLKADLEASEELIGALQISVSAADAGYEDVVKRERLALIEAAIAKVEAALPESCEKVGLAVIAMAEARGRDYELHERLGKLYVALQKSGGEPVVIFNDKTRKSTVNLAADALYAAHGAKVVIDTHYTDDIYQARVVGLIGPEPETDPEAAA